MSKTDGVPADSGALFRLRLEGKDGLSDGEYDALRGLMEGDLTGFAKLIANQESGLHSWIACWVAILLVGTKDQTDFRISIGQHPDITHASQTRRAKSKKRSRDVQTASLMYKYGALGSGKFEAAVTKVQQLEGISRSTVIARWKEHKSLFEWIERSSKKTFKRVKNVPTRFGLKPVLNGPKKS